MQHEESYVAVDVMQHAENCVAADAMQHEESCVAVDADMDLFTTLILILLYTRQKAVFGSCKAVAKDRNIRDN